MMEREGGEAKKRNKTRQKFSHLNGNLTDAALLNMCNEEIYFLKKRLNFNCFP